MAIHSSSRRALSRPKGNSSGVDLVKQAVKILSWGNIMELQSWQDRYDRYSDKGCFRELVVVVSNNGANLMVM